ncbi:MAG: hypothetical protein WC829_21775 [Hyphomicrobium sp.]|jgi:hypothetical protein
MNEMEKSSLEHTKAWLKYANSDQAKIDLEQDKYMRAMLDLRLGHLPSCTLTACSKGCPSLNRR